MKYHHPISPPLKSQSSHPHRNNLSTREKNYKEGNLLTIIDVTIDINVEKNLSSKYRL